MNETWPLAVPYTASPLHTLLQLETTLGDSGRNFKTRLFLLTGGVHTTSGGQDICPLVDSAVWTLAVGTNISKHYTTQCPFVLTATIRRVPSAYRVTRFSYISPAFRAYWSCLCQFCVAQSWHLYKSGNGCNFMFQSTEIPGSRYITLVLYYIIIIITLRCIMCIVSGFLCPSSE